MRITVVTTGGVYPFSHNGPSITLYALLKGLSELGHKIHLFFNVRGNTTCTVKQLPETNISITPNFYMNLSFPSNLLIMKKALREFLVELTQTDLIHFNTPPVYPFSLLCTFLSKFVRKKQTYFLKGGLINEDVNTIRRHLFHILANARFFNKIFIPLECLQDMCSELIGPNDIFEVVPECIVSSWYEGKSDLSLEGDPPILYAGRLAPIKRVDVLIKAFSLITHDYPKARLYIAGSGELDASLKKMTRELKIWERVTFLGEVSHNVLLNYYHSAEISVLPSDTECMSIALLEAMASKCAVITTEIGGAEIIRNGENGLIFHRGDYRALAKALRILMENYNYRKKLAKNGFQTIRKEFDYKVVAKKIEKSFQKLITN